jgi:hypothetical protein
MHPGLLWETILVATAAVFDGRGAKPPYEFTLSIEDVPGFGSATCRLLLDPVGVLPLRIAQVRRTYEPSRLVELAAIAVTALGLHHAGGREILDIAVRGSAADYLVDQARHHLEIAGRSRQRDLETAWRDRWQRLTERWPEGFYLCVAEWEGATGRLAFASPA